MKKILFLSLFFILACKPTQKTVIPAWAPYDETEELAKNATNASTKMQYKLSPIALLIKVAATVESTPPLMAITHFLSPICFCKAVMVSVIKCAGVQSCLQPQMLTKKLYRIFFPSVL